MSFEAKQCGNRECKSLGLLLCSRCRDIFYCSQKCQKLNWKDHKIICSKTKDSSTGSQASPNKTDVCQNAECGENGTLRCSRCKNVKYCSESCQRKDWKIHKKICKRSVTGTGGNSPRSDSEATTSRDNQGPSTSTKTKPDTDRSFPFKDSADKPNRPMENWLHNLTGMFLGKASSVAEEYKRAFPSDSDHVEKIREEEYVYRTITASRKMRICTLTDDKFTSPEIFAKRWGVCLKDKEHLSRFLSQPGRKPGDIYERTQYPAYQSTFFQTMRNTSVFNQVYEFGHVYVGFGFVDLFQLIWGTYQNIEDRALKLIFHGFDMSRVVTLRSKIIYGAMKHFKETEISTECILQIWFSSCWDFETQTCFKKIVHAALNSPTKFNLEKEDENLLRKWENVDITKTRAKKMFSEGLRNCSFDALWNMKFEEDRIAFCRYLFTGCIFVEENKIVCGNPTMFTKHDGSSKKKEEAFFKAIKLSYITCGRTVSILSSLYATILRATYEAVSKFRDLVHFDRIQCSFEKKLIDPKDMEFASRIRELSPYGIDWSNIPDFWPKKDFIKFARACSVEETVHHLHFLNWVWYVFGAYYIDWNFNRDACFTIYEQFQSELAIQRKKVKSLLQDTLLQFFEDEVYMNDVNYINACLSNMYKSEFEDYFLSDENGKLLNRAKEFYCDGLVTPFFDQSPTMFQAAFSFDDTLTLRITF